MTLLEKIILGIGAVLGLVGLVVSHVDPEYFTETYVREDGWIEWLTVIALLAACILMLRRGLALRKIRPLPFILVTFGAAFVFLFGAGEEISWGQRIFGLETPEAFKKGGEVSPGLHNKQGEMNLHNLVIGGVSINKLVFSKLLGVILLIYLIIIPISCERSARFRAFVDRIGIPLPRKHYVFIWIAVIVITEWLVGTGKRGELREFLLTFTLVAQLISPLNHWIYDRSRILRKVAAG